MESRRHGSHNQDRRVPEELEVVKTRLQAREKELAKVEKTNIDILKAKQELKHRFEFEKQSLQENHEGDKRNWEKTRLVMLDKIEKVCIVKPSFVRCVCSADFAIVNSEAVIGNATSSLKLDFSLFFVYTGQLLLLIGKNAFVIV